MDVSEKVCRKKNIEIFFNIFLNISTHIIMKYND